MFWTKIIGKFKCADNVSKTGASRRICDNHVSRPANRTLIVCYDYPAPRVAGITDSRWRFARAYDLQDEISRFGSFGAGVGSWYRDCWRYPFTAITRDNVRGSTSVRQWSFHSYAYIFVFLCLSGDRTLSSCSAAMAWRDKVARSGNRPRARGYRSVGLVEKRKKIKFSKTKFLMVSSKTTVSFLLRRFTFHVLIGHRRNGLMVFKFVIAIKRHE